MKLIVAVDDRWGIGKDGDLLLSIPEDMRFFREKTRAKVLVMGYNTLLSFPNGRPLPGRLNIVLNDAEGCTVSGAVVCRSLSQALELCACFASDDVFVIGGGSIYRQLMPYCDTAYITKMRFDGGADTFIPDLDAQENWSVAEESAVYDHEGIAYSFVTYRNAAPAGKPFGGTDGTMAAYFMKKRYTKFDGAAMNDGASAAKINAYLHPLPVGFSARDVDRFLAAGERSFERYLLDNGYLTAQAEIEPYAIDSEE